MARIVIDPVTRVGGHLHLELELDGSTVADAWSAGTMFRGFERLLEGRDPRDAWLMAQRICGACTAVHALASVRAVEEALAIRIPPNARLVRNILAGTQYLRDHVVRFYTLHSLDWVDAAAALEADPEAAAALARSLGDLPGSTARDMAAVQAQLEPFVGSGTGAFGAGYWGHPAYQLSPEADLVVLGHYFGALEWQREAIRIQTLFGGKSPHPQTYLVGGMSMSPPWGGPQQRLPGEHPTLAERDAPVALSDRGLDLVERFIESARVFIDNAYVPDVLLLAREHPEWGRLGAGIGNYLAFGEFPEDDTSRPALLLPRGRVTARGRGPVAAVDQAGITEYVSHAHYRYEAGDAVGHRPLASPTEPAWGGPPPPVTTFEGAPKYSWVKAPRYDDEAMEVGPLARLLVARATGRPDVEAALDEAVTSIGGGPDVLFSTIGRLVARAVEAQLIVRRMQGWLDELRASLAGGDLALANVTKWSPSVWPAEAIGWSLGEGPGGAVGHWIHIGGARVDRYDVVDGSSWNGSPRDAQGRRGAVEEALVGTPLADARRPLEALRTVHSFDPCLACAVHAFDGRGATPAVRFHPEDHR
jgi:Ni,Fe-hydrogenase I large subunit